MAGEPFVKSSRDSDFNDQATAHGLEAVRASILAVMSKDGVSDVSNVQASNGAASGCNGTESDDVSDVTKDESDPPEAPQAASPIPTLEERPRFVVLDDWHREGERRWRPGVWFFGVKPAKLATSPILTEQWICSPLHIEAVTHDQASNNIGRLLRFKTTLGTWREWAMPCDMLAGDGSELRGELLSMGVEFDPLSRNLFGQYLSRPAPKRRIHCALAVGWCGESFVLPDVVIGPKASGVIFQSGERGHDEYTTAGTLEGWQEAIGARAVGNPLLCLALSAAFAGPLLGRVNGESGGVHIVGDSSTGKSTAIEAACSVWGGAGFKRSWRATSNGMKGAASLFNDSLLALDEISECDPREVGDDCLLTRQWTRQTEIEPHRTRASGIPLALFRAVERRANHWNHDGGRRPPDQGRAIDPVAGFTGGAHLWRVG